MVKKAITIEETVINDGKELGLSLLLAGQIWMIRCKAKE